MRKSKITKSISRKINTGPYETLQVSVGAEEEIEWDTLDERARKSDNLSKVVALDFQETLAKVIEELKVANKPAKINVPKPENNLESVKVSGVNKTIISELD